MNLLVIRAKGENFGLEDLIISIENHSCRVLAIEIFTRVSKKMPLRCINWGRASVFNTTSDFIFKEGAVDVLLQKYYKDTPYVIRSVERYDMNSLPPDVWEKVNKHVARGQLCDISKSDFPLVYAC